MARIPFHNVDLDMIYDDDKTFPLMAETEDEQGRVYRYVKYNQGDGSVDGVAGRIVVGLDSAYPDGEVTMDYSSSTINVVPQDIKGALQAALTDGKCGWAQKTGRNRVALLTDSGVSQDDLLMKHATTDGALDTHDGSAAVIVGVALEDDTGSALSAGQANLTIP